MPTRYDRPPAGAELQIRRAIDETMPTPDAWTDQELTAASDAVVRYLRDGGFVIRSEDSAGPIGPPDLPLTVATAHHRAAHWAMVAEQRLGAAFSLVSDDQEIEEVFLSRRAQATAEAHAAGQLAETWTQIALTAGIDEGESVFSPTREDT